MASILPPQPTGVPPNHAYWNTWYNKLREIINGIATSIKWINLDFTGSKIEDIADRQHNKLQSIQGGAVNDYYHLTNVQYSGIIALANPDVTGTNLNMTVQPAAPAINVNAGTLQLKARAGTGTGLGGPLELRAGDSATSTGGSVNVYAGAGSSGGQFYFTAGQGSSTGGDFNVVAGDATASSGVGGSVYLTAGNATTGGGSTGGNLYLTSGAGDTTGGQILFFSGLASSQGLELCDDGTNPTVGFYGVAPVGQATTSGPSSSFTANVGTAINSASTFDGYTVAQVVKALRDIGILS